MNVAYKNYWQRKQLASNSCPSFPALPYTTSDHFDPVDKIVFDTIQEGSSLLDFGAGDLRLQKKFVRAGYQGDYKTLDISVEYSYDYGSIEQVQSTFDSILFMDVIEHLPLNKGLELLNSLIDKLNPKGSLILQTPNARCLRNPMATDMTHLHIYNLKDLWAHTTAMDLQSSGWRVFLQNEGRGPIQKFKDLISKAVTTKILGSDYADNILLIIKKAPQ